MLTMQTINNIKRKFRVLEDNGGGLTLFVWDEQGTEIVFAHSGYEYNPGSLCQDLDALAHDDDPLTWDGNEEFLFDEYDNMYFSTKEIVSNEDIYYNDMGASGTLEFCS